jgi:hypothetical protein
MAISLYDISVATYLQQLGAVSSVLAKGAEYAAENKLDLAEIVETKLRPDMLPFRFQVISAMHHSLGAVNAMRSGELNAPPSMDELDYAGLQGLVDDAISELKAATAQEINALEGGSTKFKMGDFEIPFTTENFVLCFSLPNFYFHVTTTYDILRVAGVPLGKMDFLGEMRVGS